mmetsp:Transcript_18612/g.44961  ORF Transcript_18612/g.44961 Transcript_18612/m.44961 type:complete len:513 (-) Transcript_18612:97-1635(-)
MGSSRPNASPRRDISRSSKAKQRHVWRIRLGAIVLLPLLSLLASQSYIPYIRLLNVNLSPDSTAVEEQHQSVKLRSVLLPRQQAPSNNVTTTSAITASVDGKNSSPRSRSGSRLHSHRTSCNITLHEMVIQMAFSSSPKHSGKAWTKTRRILNNASKFHIMTPSRTNGIFDSTTENLIELMEGYGLEQVHSRQIDPENSNEHIWDDVLIVEYAYATELPMLQRQCIGRYCNSMKRIVIQTEQIPAWKPGLTEILKCHTSPHCTIWDFSESNFVWYRRRQENQQEDDHHQHKNSRTSDSVMILPHMFHDRLQKYYNRNSAAVNHSSSSSSLKQYNERTLDYSFIGAITERRRTFFQRYIQHQQNMTTSNNNISTGLSSSSSLSDRSGVFKTSLNMTWVVEQYQNSILCLVVHSYDTGFGGEYHRLSDLKRSGCIPVMEKFEGDIPATQVLEQCAGVKFAEFDDLPKLMIDEWHRLDNTAVTFLREQQLSIDDWWDTGIHWDTLLNDIFGPRDN